MRLLFFLLILVYILPAYAITKVHELENEIVRIPAARLEGFIKSLENDIESETAAGNKERLALLYKKLGIVEKNFLANYEKALGHFIVALSLENELGLKDDLAVTYYFIASVFRETGGFQKAELYLLKALNYTKDPEYAAFLQITLGKAYSQTGKNELALKAFETAIENAETIQEELLIAEALYSHADLLILLKKLKEALAKHKEALAIWRAKQDKAGEANSLSRIAEVYKLMNNQDKALANIVVALEIRKQIGDKAGLAANHNQAGAIYLSQRNVKRAIANLDLGLKYGQEAQENHHVMKSYEYLHLCYKQLKDYKQAHYNLEHYLAISEMLSLEKNARQVMEKESSHTLSEKQSELDKMQLEHDQKEKALNEQKLFNIFLFAVMGLSLVIVALFIYLYKQKKISHEKLADTNLIISDKNTQLEELNNTKDKFFSIISHDLKGPLNSLTSFSGLLINHVEALSKEEIQMLAKDLDKSVKNLFALLENLLEWSRSQTGKIEFVPEQFDLADLLHQNYDLLQAQAKSKQIELQIKNGSRYLVTAHKNSVNTVIRNLISNSIKFTPAGGTVALAIQPAKNPKEVIVSISDTGVGMPEAVLNKLFRIDSKYSTAGTAQEKGTGLGLILCKEFVEKNGGRIWVESEESKGSVFSFTLPLKVGV